MKTNQISSIYYFKYLFSALILLKAVSVSAQDGSGQKFTLEQAIEYGIKNQVDIRNAQIDAEIAKARTEELIGMGLPQIDASADINDYLEIPTSFVPTEFFGGAPGEYAPVQFGQQYTASAGINATQLLFDGTYLVGVKASKTYVELAKKNLSRTKIETAVGISKAYYYVLVAEKRLQQLVVDISRLEKLRDDTKAMYDNGFVEKIDYDRIELSYNLVKSQLEQTQRFVSNSYNILKFQMGMDLKSSISLAENIDNLEMDPAILIKDSLNYDSRIEYSILKTQYQLAGMDLKRYKTARWPSLVAFGNLTTVASRNEFDFIDPSEKWYPTAVIGAKLSVPIFRGYQIGSQVQQAKLNYKKVENSFYQLEQSLQLENQNSENTLRSNLEKLNIQDKNRNLAREIARVSKIKYEQGVGSNLEVIDAEASLREAETNYYLVLLETIVSKIDLDKSLGNFKY